MAETEDAIANKRKASPAPVEDAADIKRAKFEGGDGDSPLGNGNDQELNKPSNGTTPVEDEKREHRERSPARSHDQKHQRDSRESPEARRPSLSGGLSSRKSISQEEKKRGQRLFGGLLTALSRPTSASQQQKRLEIERRQQEKAQQRRAEDDKRRVEKLEKLRRVRQIEQLKLEEQAMRSRHSSMLARAQSLQTKSEPRLYYLPWELTKDQEEIIRDQIQAAEQTIQKENREFKMRKTQRLRELGVATPPRSPSPPPREPEQEQEQEAQSGKAPVGEPKHVPQDTNPDAAARPSSKARNLHDKEHDENGDEMMQDEEDTVIY